MPTTSRWALRYPSLSAGVNVPADVQALAEDTDGKLARLLVCTSTTRPAGVTGLSILETDTNLTFVFVAGAWKLSSQVSRNYSPGTPSGFANFSVSTTICSLQVPAVSWDRNVVVHGQCVLDKTDASLFDVGIARDGAAALSVTSSQASGRTTFTPSYAFSLPAGQTTAVQMYAARIANAGLATVFADSLINRLLVLTVPS